MTSLPPTPAASPPGLEVEVLPEETHAEAQATATRAILAAPDLRLMFPAADLWVVGFDLADKGDDDGPRFTATVVDTVTGRAALVDGWLDDLGSPRTTPLGHQRPPTDDEHAWAVSVLADDRHLGPLLAADGTTTYRPTPPLANVEHPDGTVDRVIAVGIRTAAGAHRVAGVRTGDGEVFPDPPGAAPPSDRECGPPPAPLTGGPAAPGESQARVRVRRGDDVLWELVVVRPRASSGTNGSGVELRAVSYKGQQVLFRAHVPIATVAYEHGAYEHGADEHGASEGGPGPTSRDWLHEESGFEAEGEEAVPGFRLCPTAPATILDREVDGGGFRGVALWVEGDEVVIASQLQAGWYRYVSQWRLAADGTIRPRIGFAAAANPGTWRSHVHHAYWRLDLDVLEPATNVVQEYNDPPVQALSNWHTVKVEVRRPRSSAHGRYWRVRNIRASQGYSLRPGPADGTADVFGAGDVWVLRYHSDELDDGEGTTADRVRARPGLDRLMSGESVERQDLVLWYGVHVRHQGAGEADGDGAKGAPALVGPDLVPYQWKDAPLGPVAFAPLAPPTDEELRPPAPPSA
ncbi:MAG: hypothetical protein ABR511_06975 [Acidimicrobiales bacterium]